MIGHILKRLSPLAVTSPFLTATVFFSRIYSTDTPVSTWNSNGIMGRFTAAQREAIWGLCTADALAMPVHWYYDPLDIKRSYDGWLNGYRAPNKRHPSSILSLSAVDGSGRNGWGQKSQPLIGHVILHDKLKYWTSSDRSVHYHQGMKAGDSTLNSLIALEILKTVQRVDPQGDLPLTELQAHVLEDYVRFMTTPGSHGDTYAESFHRSFFKEWSAEQTPPTRGPEILKFAQERSLREDHQLSSVGALVPAIAWIIHTAGKSEEECVQTTLAFVKLTHPVPSLFPYVEIYARLLHRVLNGKDLQTEIQSAFESKKLGGKRKFESIKTIAENSERFTNDSEKRLEIHQEAISQLGIACYIEGSLSSALYLAYSFHDDFSQGVLTNANCGGENCHRGAALGALLGASTGAKGQQIDQKWKDGLGSAKEGITQLMTGQ